MYLNTFLYMFGLDPDNFVNELVEPFESDDGAIIYNLRQRTDIGICKACQVFDAEINNYSWTETNFTTNEGRPVILRIKKVRFKCKICGKTFTPKLIGIDRYAKIGKQVKTLIINEFYKQKSFSIIANDYRISQMQVIRIFDEAFHFIKKGVLPVALCIDEIGFKSEDGNYAAILYDHDKRRVIDVIRNRQKEYLKDYFYHCYPDERRRVRYFISDLYEGYSFIKDYFFKDAIHIADMFHVIRLLRVEVSRLRIRTYKEYTEEGDVERSFMKIHWDYFEKFLDTKVAHKPYYCQKEHFEYTTWQMMKRCLELNQTFWDAYACLQDFYEYYRCKSFDQAIKHIEKIINQLKRTEDEGLVRVANTYNKWKIEIANAITVRNENGKRYSNGPAEGLNNAIKTLIKDANGYRNFERFRKRVLLVLGKRKDPLT